MALYKRDRDAYERRSTDHVNNNHEITSTYIPFPTYNFFSSMALKLFMIFSTESCIIH